MAVMAHEHEPLARRESLDSSFLDLSVPPGWRPELIEGEIVVTPPPDGNHGRVPFHIADQLSRSSAERMEWQETKGLVLPAAEAGAVNRVIPDLTVTRYSLDLFNGAASWMPCDGVLMVVEVTSANPRRDREDKRVAYARGEIPFYLLVDRAARTTTLFQNPKDGDYASSRTEAFGRPVDLPPPFAFALDTTRFA